MYDAREIANFLLDYADSRRRPVSNMALLKHIYFAHGWHLAQTGKPLIKNRIEAWQHGPVVRVVYDAFKRFKSNPITSRATIMDWTTGEELVAQADVELEVEDLLRDTFNSYSTFNAIQLSEITHDEGGPWHTTWHRTDGRVVLNMEISNDQIREHFISALRRGRPH